MVSIIRVDLADLKLSFNIVGQWRGVIPLPRTTSLEESETNLQGSDKEAFLRFMRQMLQWQPERRQTAKELLQDPWLNS